MFPLLISSSPQNGAEDVGLNEEIEIVFDGYIDTNLLDEAIVTLENYNINQEIATPNILPGRTDDSGYYFSIRIVPQSDPVTGNAYSSLTEYRLTVSGLTSLYGERMDGLLELRFITEEGSVEDYLDEDSIVQDVFEVIRTYPKENSFTNTDTIRIKCSDDIHLNSDFSSIMVIKGEDSEDALFMGEVNLISSADVSISESSQSTLLITIPVLDPATKYSVVIKGIINTGNVEIEPLEYTFSTAYDPSYSDLDSILDMTSIRIITQTMDNEDIIKIIYQNSKLAEFIAEQAENTEIDWVGPAIYVSEYVKYKTQYDIVFDKFIELSGQPTSKQLKDLTIEYGWQIGDLLELADRLRARYEYWLMFIQGKTSKFARAGVFKKGEQADEIPDFMDRKFRDREGTKSW